MVNEILKQLLGVAANAGIKGELEIKTMEVRDSSNVAGIIVSPYNGEQGEIRIFLYKEEAEITISASSGAGMDFAKKVQDGISSHPEVFSCIINER